MWLKRILMVLGLVAAAPTYADSAALSWLTGASEREGIWQRHGDVRFPSRQIFVGDPTWGDDYHIRDPRVVPADNATLYTFSEAVGEQNYLIWMEFSGTTPVATGEVLGFGVDAATIALGALEGGQALVELGERYLDENKGDSHTFILPHIDKPNDFANWVPIPGSDTRIFLTSAGSDGGLEAIWLMDASGATSGILIDIVGRASDGRYLDKLLPAQ